MLLDTVTRAEEVHARELLTSLKMSVLKIRYNLRCEDRSPSLLARAALSGFLKKQLAVAKEKRPMTVDCQFTLKAEYSSGQVKDFP